MNSNFIIAGSLLIVRNTSQWFILDEENFWTPSVFMVKEIFKNYQIVTFVDNTIRLLRRVIILSFFIISSLRFRKVDTNTESTK